MWILTTIICGLFFLFDVSLLKKKNENLYFRHFRCAPWQTVVMSLLLFLAVLSPGETSPLVLRVSVCVILAVYLLRRHAFFVGLKSSELSLEIRDEKLELALSTLSILGWWALFMIIASLEIEIIFNVFLNSADDLASTLLISEISVVILLILIYRFSQKQKTLRLSEILGLETKGLGGWKIWGLPMVFAVVYSLGTSYILDTRPVQPMTPMQEMLNSTNSVGVLLFFAATAVLTAPFFEEVIFRGFFFYVIRPFKGVAFAVIFVALIFGVLHVEQYWGDGQAIAVVGLFGLSLTLLRAWTGSAVPGMIAHYVYNTSLIIIPLVLVVIANPIYFSIQMNYFRMSTEEKEEKLLASIHQNPEFANSYNDLAWLYSEEEINLDRALELIDRAIELEPDNFAYWDTKAEIFFKMQRIPEAIAIAERLVDQHPRNKYLLEQLKKFQNNDRKKTIIEI